VRTSPVKVQAPIVRVRTSPVRANVKVEAPKIEVKADLDLRMKCWNCGGHNLKLMSIADLNKLNGSAKASVSASVSAPRVAGNFNAKV